MMFGLTYELCDYSQTLTALGLAAEEPTVQNGVGILENLFTTLGGKHSVITALLGSLLQVVSSSLQLFIAFIIAGLYWPALILQGFIEVPTTLVEWIVLLFVPGASRDLQFMCMVVAIVVGHKAPCVWERVQLAVDRRRMKGKPKVPPRLVSCEDQCPICFDELISGEGEERLSHCAMGCGKSVHASCMKQWLLKQEDMVTKPSCSAMHLGVPNPDTPILTP